MKTTLDIKLARFIIEKRNLLAIISTILFLVFAGGLSNLYFDSSYRAYFSEENPELVAFESMEKIYTKEDNVIIVLKSSIFGRYHHNQYIRL